MGNNFTDESEKYHINGFTHFSVLALEYFPRFASQSSASKKMRAGIERNAELLAELEAANYTRRTIDVSPEMQLIIYRYWGPPKADLPIDTNAQQKEGI